MNTTVEEIKKHIDIVDFIGSYIPLKKAGRNFKANCPFHQEKTPSFIISPDRQIWRCFGACQTGGDVITFLMKWEGITFFEALKDLSKKTGIPIKDIDFSDDTWKKRELLFDINKKASDYFAYLLTNHTIGTYALDYLKDRKLTDRIIKTFNLGYAPSSWDSLTNYFKKKNVPLNEAVDAGLLIQSSTGRFFDRFRKRIMFPLCDHRGNIVGFSGRIIDPSEKEAKYVNTPESFVYHKRELLFGLHLTKDQIKKVNNVIVTEGELDMISLFQQGIDNAVAVKGSAVTKDQLMLLKRYTNRLILSLDSDTAGEETTKRAISDAEALEFEINILSFDWAKDPDEAIHKNPIEFKKILKHPVPIYDYILSMALSKYPERDIYSIQKIGDTVIPYISLIKNPIVKTYYVKKIASLLETDVQSVKQRIKQYMQKRAPFTIPITITKKTAEESRYELLQRYILYLVIQSKHPEERFKKLSEIIQPHDFSSHAISKLFVFMKEHYDLIKKNKDVSSLIRALASTLPKELLPAFDRIILFYHEELKDKVTEKEFIKLIYECKRSSLKKQLEKSVGTSDEEQTDKLKKSVSSLQKSLSEVEKMLTIL